MSSLHFRAIDRAPPPWDAFHAMARGEQQSHLNEHFAHEQGELQKRVVILEDAVLALERTLTALLGVLDGRGHLEDAGFVAEWTRAVELLREQGLPRRPMPGLVPPEGVTCPSCRSVLRNILGARGDRCDWCGYVFPLRCPSCSHELENLEGVAGEVCLWCQHRFG